MNKNALRAQMAMHGETQQNLAAALGLSLSRFNAKINEYQGASFTVPEMQQIIQRYGLSADEAQAIFYPAKID